MTATLGRPLEAGLRDTLSSRFRTDFSNVRVHTGPEADQSARALGARAYTVGSDVVFSAGAYDPLGAPGRSLIAHELAHVAQHGGRPHAPSCYLGPGHAVPPADARLERQADVAAGAWTRPLPHGWAWERAAAPFVGRVAPAWVAPPQEYVVPYADGNRTITREHTDPSMPRAVRVDLGDLRLPADKGPWEAHYRALAEQGNLQAVVALQGRRVRAGLWQKRAPSDELRRLWLLRVGWPAANAAAWWHEAGGDQKTAFAPSVDNVPSQIDHIVELQLGGTNVPENLAPHDGPANEASGRAIFAGVREAAVAVADVVRQRPGMAGLDTVVLHFSGASQIAPYAKDTTPREALPAEETARAAALERRRATRSSSALQVHATAVRDAAAGTRPSPADRAAADAARGPLTDFRVEAGTAGATLKLPGGSDPVPLENSDIAENAAARELVAGVVLASLTRQHTPRRVLGHIDDPAHPTRSGTRLPISVPDAGDKRLTFAVGDGGRLRLHGGTKRVRFTYPYLSTGSLTLRTTDTGALEGTGTLTPSVPLLRRAVIDVRLAEGRLEGSVAADPSKLRLPPFRITEASVNVRLAPELAVDGRIAFALGSLVTGDVTAGLDTQGLFARGRVQARVPGLERSEGEISYRPAEGVRGHAVASAAGGSGLVRSGEVRIDFTDTSWTVTGRIGLVLPGGSPAELEVVQRDGRVVYTGRTRLTVPGLRPVDVELSYDGEHVRGSARTTFTVLGATGDVDLRYSDGAFTGEGRVQLQRGRFAGALDARLDARGRISGRGTGTLTLRPGLVATVGVELSPEQRLRLTGELRFPPYRFLEPRSQRRELFSRSLPPVPIFAVPLGIGSVGLVATISGGMAVRYGFGPGEIRDMVVRAQLDPLEDDPNLEAEASARLVIPAEAGLELSARVGLGASVVFATASGGITVTGGVLLRGGLDAAAVLRYRGGVVSLDAEAAIRVQPVLTLRLEADLVIDAPAAGPWRWPYELAAYSYATGLEFGMVAPFHYATDEPLRMPSASDIRWIVPDIDVAALADRLTDRVRTGIGV